MGEGRTTMIKATTKNLRFPLKLNLQHFAEGGDDGTVTEPTAEPTFEDVLKNKSYQSEFDRRVAKALETARGKWEIDYTQKLEDAKTEAEKLSNMKAEEKFQYEMDKQRKELDARVKELNTKELRAEAAAQLMDAGISKEYLDFINYDNAETVKSSIDKLMAIRTVDLEKAVTAKLGSNEPPKRGTSTEDIETEKLRKIMGL